MALFRSSIIKKSALVNRVSSVVVYNVHSHLQYTSACSAIYTREQVQQRFNCPQNDLSLLNNKQLPIQINKTDKKSIQGLIDNALPNRKALLGEALAIDSFTNTTHLALMSLNYDEKWCRNFKTVYTNALKSRRLLGYDNITENDDSKISYMYHRMGFHEISGELSSVCSTEKHKARSDQVIGNGSDLCQSVAAPNIVMFSNQCKHLEKEKEKKKKVDDKCDPLQLATVYQTLRDELPVFFQKGHGYSLYHKNVKFINGLTNTTFSGLRTYKCVMTSMRLAAQTCMSDITMEILKITKDSKECNVKVRWRVSGMPRYAFILGNQKDNTGCRYVDGFSIFEVDTQGLICCHRLLKLIPSQSPQIDNPLWAINTAAVIALLRQQKSFEMLARHRVEDIEDTCLPF